MSSLRRGDRGAAVTEIRAALTALGMLDNSDEEITTGRHVVVDMFDVELDQAVRAFQQHRGLLVDGIVGEATYRALKEASYRLGARTLSHQFGAPMFGDDVATLQARLQDLGFYTGLVDARPQPPMQILDRVKERSGPWRAFAEDLAVVNVHEG